MDLSINSAVQSPLVRNLETVSTKATSLVHHIPDNLPPLSKTNVRTNIYTGTTSGAIDRTVDIPQVGYLAKVELEITFDTAATEMRPTNYLAYQMLDKVNIKTRNRIIETQEGLGMYGAIGLEGYQKSMQRAFESCLMSAAAGREGLPTSNHLPVLDATAAARMTRVEIPFASCDNLSVAYNTRFVEPLQLQTQLKAPAGQEAMALDETRDAASLLRYRKVDAIFHFVNYHDLSEQDIRSSNFKPNLPAVVFQRDMMHEPTATALDTAPDSLTNTVRLRSNNLCYAIAAWIGGQGTIKIDAGASPGKAEAFATTRIFPISELKFKASGQTLYGERAPGCLGRDAITQDLSTWTGDAKMGHAMYADDGGTTVYETDGSHDPASQLLKPAAIGNSLVGRDGLVVNHAVPLKMSVIEFGLGRNCRYNSGAVGLQTLSNPEVEITTYTATDASWHHLNKADRDQVQYNVYVYYYALVQIDSGTGAVTRSLDH